MKQAHTFAARFLLAGALILAPAAFASDAVKIADVGLQGYYSAEGPTIVRVLVIHAGPGPATIELRVHVHSVMRMKIERVDTFTKFVNLAANEQRMVDVPVVITPGERTKVEVEEADDRGQVLGKDSIPINEPVQGSLIAIVCAERQICQEAQSQIAFSGESPEQSAKGKQLKFVSVEYPLLDWLGYDPARTVVLAGPAAQMLPDQRMALEGFVRHGGTLIVVQDSVRDPSFLAAYRTGVSSGTPIAVGRGKIFWIPSLQSKELGELYAGAGLMRAIIGWQPWATLSNELDWARNRLSTRFRFPTLTWLLVWLAVYILIAGVGNFMVLRLIDRREWGWVTLPCLSILFALAMYISSASNRPREFRAEEVTFYWMDENSPVAAVERGERISSPHRRTLDFVLNDNMILAGDRNGTGTMLSVNPFENDSQDQIANHWDVRTGPPVEVTLRMLQWSFRELEFDGIEKEPGTLRFAGPGHLRNDTGKSFSQALYVDKDTVYTLDGLAAGADINLTSAKQKPLGKIIVNRNFSGFGYPTALSETDPNEMMAAAQQTPDAGTEDGTAAIQDLKGLSERPFDLTELIRGWPRKGGHVFDSRSGIFLGLAEEPDPPVSLSAAPFGRKGYSITVVSFERKP
jgi:hypothetical protein